MTSRVIKPGTLAYKQPIAPANYLSYRLFTACLLMHSSHTADIQCLADLVWQIAAKSIHEHVRYLPAIHTIAYE